MLMAFLHGFILALGLILPLGVQNLFVLQQGILQPRLWKTVPAVVTAALCDTVLISCSVGGVAWLLAGMESLRLVFHNDTIEDAKEAFLYGMDELAKLFCFAANQCNGQAAYGTAADCICDVGIFFESLCIYGYHVRHWNELLRICRSREAGFYSGSCIGFLALVYFVELPRPCIGPFARWFP